MDKLLQIQELVSEYFKDTDNKTLVELIDAFVYYTPKDNSDIGKLITKFFKDNEIEKVYLNYLIDKEEPKRFFLKSNPSDLEMIQNIKISLLNLSFNRFRQIDHVTPKKADKIKVLGTSEVEKGVHLVCTINHNYTTCSLMIDGDMIGDTEITDEKIDCEHCLEIIKNCREIEL